MSKIALQKCVSFTFTLFHRFVSNVCFLFDSFIIITAILLDIRRERMCSSDDTSHRLSLSTELVVTSSLSFITFIHINAIIRDFIRSENALTIHKMTTKSHLKYITFIGCKEMFMFTQKVQTVSVC